MTQIRSQQNTQVSPNTHALIGGALSTLAYVYLATSSQQYGQATLTDLLSVSLWCALISFWIWFVHSKNQVEIRIPTLIGFAVLFRVIGLFTFPILEDDVYRYLWDARNFWETGSPYGIVPADAFAADDLGERFETILDSINYPFIATVYGPTCQWLFALAYLIAPGEIWPLQLLFGLIDLALILVLLKLAKPTAVLLYAWSPLIIKEFVVTAHPDVLGAFLVVLAILLFSRKQFLLVGTCLALAAGVKVFALVLAPFILRFYWQSWLSFFITAVVIALPFGIVDAWLPAGLGAMSANWLFNAPLYVLFGQWLAINTIKIILLGLFVIASGLYVVYEVRYELMEARRTDLHLSLHGDLLFAGLFLCTPALNAWYLVWLLPFAVLRPSLWAWVASVTILLSYASGINLGGTQLEPYEHYGSVIGLEFALPLLAALYGVYRYRKDLRTA